MIVTLPCAIIIIRRTNNNWALLRDKWPISPLRVGYLSVTGGLISCEDWSFRPKYTDAVRNTPVYVQKKYEKLSRKLFLLWEFLAAEGLCQEAREYLEDHKDDEMPMDFSFILE